jgi:hypothetical protein
VRVSEIVSGEWCGFVFAPSSSLSHVQLSLSRPMCTCVYMCVYIYVCVCVCVCVCVLCCCCWCGCWCVCVCVFFFGLIVLFYICTSRFSLTPNLHNAYVVRRRSSSPSGELTVSTNNTSSDPTAGSGSSSGCSTPVATAASFFPLQSFIGMTTLPASSR